MGFELKGGEQKRTFPSGAQRDAHEGKGRYDLLQHKALHRVAVVAEKGGLKYGDDNWRKGIPDPDLFDSALRHLHQACSGKVDEDHLAQCVWNVLCIMEFQEDAKDVR